LAPWYEETLDPDWRERRAEAIDLLVRERQLLDVVALVGADALPDEDRVVLEVARLLREAFLQQHAFDPVDAARPPGGGWPPGRRPCHDRVRRRRRPPLRAPPARGRAVGRAPPHRPARPGHRPRRAGDRHRAGRRAPPRPGHLTLARPRPRPR